MRNLICLMLVLYVISSPILESQSLFHRTFTTLNHTNGIEETHSYSEYNYALNTTHLIQFFSKTRAKRDVKNFVPAFLGTLNTTTNIDFAGSCFQKSVASFLLDEETKTVTVAVQTNEAVSWTCSDWFIFATRQSFHVKPVFFRGKHSITMGKFLPGEWEDIKKNGMHMFYLADGLLGTFIDTWGAFKILDGIYFMQNRMDFIKENLGIEVKPRKVRRVPLREEDIDDGDVFFRTTFDGPDVVLMYGTGGTIGHVLMALRFDGELYIVESTDVGVVKTPWRKWILEQDDETQVVSVAKLHPKLRAKFDTKKAVEFFKAREGSRYGYQNIVFSWIDTVSGNYPKPLDARIIPAFLKLVDVLHHPIVQLLFIDGVNTRFKHHMNYEISCSSMDCVFEACDKMNITLAEVFAMVERDQWKYDDGHVMVCSAFLTQIFKVAGIFSEEITESIEGNEFTPRDVYMLNIWDTEWKRPEGCGDEPYCQFIGKYEWKMLGFNSIVPYPHMNQKCSAFPPQYTREPSNC